MNHGCLESLNVFRRDFFKQLNTESVFHLVLKIVISKMRN